MTSRGFAALMALSQAQTQESTRAADSIQAERRRKEEARRRQQEEEDRKERERQAKMLRHRLEEQKREKERQEKREREREAHLKEIGRREEEQRQALLYGSKRAKDVAPRHPTSSAASKRISEDDDEAGLALTREEKRERRLQLQFSQNAARRAGSSAGTSRVGRRLPGGAVNVTASSQSTDGSAGGTHSVRARLTAMPNTLTKLNTIKRDTRTIDEILRDRAKARENKTLEGEEAREFHDWFGTKSTTGMATKASSPSSPAASGASTPSKPPYRPDSTSSTLKRPSSPRPSGSRAPSLPASKPTPKTVTKSSSLSAKLSRPSSLTNKAASGSSVPLPKKRARTPPSAYSGSESDSEYDHHPRKRAPAPSNGIQDEIWKIFGRDRSKYVARNVMSDDEDMEADVVALEREEFVRYVTNFLTLFP